MRVGSAEHASRQRELFEEPAQNPSNAPPADVEKMIASARERFARDAREQVFEVRAEPRGSGVALVGQATAGADELVRELGLRIGRRLVTDEIARMPAPGAAPKRAIVKAAFAPIHARAAIASPLTSQVVMGRELEVLGEA